MTDDFAPVFDLDAYRRRRIERAARARRRCTVCRELLPPSTFGPREGGALRSACRPCEAARDRERKRRERGR